MFYHCIALFYLTCENVDKKAVLVFKLCKLIRKSVFELEIRKKKTDLYINGYFSGSMANHCRSVLLFYTQRLS